jgi:hypothetical protein
MAKTPEAMKNKGFSVKLKLVLLVIYWSQLALAFASKYFLNL